MFGHERFVVVCLFIIILENPTLSSLPGVHRKFEYKYSFKGPHLVQRDGTIPFWEHTGHAIASDESIRITPSLRSKKGQVWSKDAFTAENWEVEVIFRISGRGRIGADGLAIWFSEEKGQEGPVFGSSDKWKGLGVFFDSFDNDGQHNNPYIMAMVNDGNLNYDHNSDGSSQQLGGCLRDFRNKPFPIRARIEYYKKALTVMFHSGMTNNNHDYEMCLRVENVEIPSTGYFGVTAATGGLADDHDVSSFLTHSLTPPSDIPVGQEVPEDDRKKFELEFDEYYDKLQKAKEEYQKEHPDRKPYDENDERLFESQDTREMKQIFEGQTAIHNTVRDLNRKLDEVIGRQERTMSQLSLLAQNGQRVPPPPGPPSQGGDTQQQLPYVDTIQRHEVESVLNNQRDLLQSIRDIKSTVNDVSGRVTRSAGSSGYDGTQHYSDVKNSINNMHNDVKSIIGSKGQAAQCPPVPETSCVTTFYLFLFMIAQVLAFVGYAMYRNSKEAAAKKFY